MIRNGIMEEEAFWEDDGNMEYWNDGILRRANSDPASFFTHHSIVPTIHYSVT
jgi:hypothetical protein